MAEVPAVSDEVRFIESDGPPQRFARGWHCIGLAKEFRDGKPHEIKAFGTMLVVFADSKGAIKVLDAHCRHLGGNLADGRVKGDTVVCPFHGWEWAGNGRCKNIPYARRVPPIAKTRSWHTQELHGQVFVWHDHEGNPPPAESVIPEIEAYGDGDWSDWTWNSLVIEGSNCREIIDNIVDMAHFYYVHFAFPTYFKNIFEGEIATQISQVAPRQDVVVSTNYGDTAAMYSEASYFGPSYMIQQQTVEAGGVRDVNMYLINCHYPIDENSFRLQYGIMAKRREGLSMEETQEQSAEDLKGVELGFLQDVEIWKRKAPIDNPLLSEEDGPVYQLRRWYQQFYTDVSDVTEDMTNRFEFEIDTTRAVESWKKEVEYNVEHGVDVLNLNN